MLSSETRGARLAEPFSYYVVSLSWLCMTPTLNWCGAVYCLVTELGQLRIASCALIANAMPRSPVHGIDRVCMVQQNALYAVY